MLIDSNRSVRVAVLGILLAAGSVVRGQEAGISDKVKDLVAKMEKSSVEEAWKTSDELARLGDRAVPSIEEHLGSASLPARLGAARALLALKDVPRAAKTLVAIVKESTDDKIRIIALNLLIDRNVEEAGDQLSALLDQ